MRLRSLMLVAALSMFAPLPMLADTTYTYTGNPFTAGSAGAVSGSFTVALPLGDDLSFATIVPSFYSFTDGSVTFTIGDPGITHAGFTAFSTDSHGNITSWDFLIGTADNNTFVHSTSNVGGNPVFDEGTGGGINGNDPGTWSSSAAGVTPEPSSFVMLGTGLLGVVRAVRRRFVRG